METVTDFILGASKITADGDRSHEINKTLAPWKKSYNQPRQHIKKQRHYFSDKGPSSQSYDEPSESCSVMTDFLRPHGLYSSWNYSGQNT